MPNSHNEPKVISLELIRQNGLKVVNIFGILESILNLLEDNTLNNQPILTISSTNTSDRLKTSISNSTPIITGMLIPKLLYEDDTRISAARLSRTESMNQWGYQIYGEPFDILGVEIYEGEEHINEYLFVTDRAWDRIILSDNITEEWLTVGSMGDGDYNFRSPTGIAPNARQVSSITG